MLINCYECNGAVSDLASVCPHCGAPVKKSQACKQTCNSNGNCELGAGLFVSNAERFRSIRYGAPPFPTQEAVKKLTGVQHVYEQCKEDAALKSPLQRMEIVKDAYFKCSAIVGEDCVNLNGHSLMNAVCEEVLKCLGDIDALAPYFYDTKHLLEEMSGKYKMISLSPHEYVQRFFRKICALESKRMFVELERDSSAFSMCSICKSKHAEAACAFHIPLSGDCEASCDGSGKYEGSWTLVDLAVPRCPECAMRFSAEFGNLKNGMEKKAHEFEELEKKSFVLKKQEKLQAIRDEYYELKDCLTKLRDRQYSGFQVYKRFMDIGYQIGETYVMPSAYTGRGLVGKTPSGWTPESENYVAGSPRRKVSIG